jgi:hypothetical protein
MGPLRGRGGPVTGSRRPRLEVRIPISPFPWFFSNVKLAALSLARLGEPYSSAKVVVSVGDHADLGRTRDANRWAEDLPVVWRMVPREVCDLDGLAFAPGGDRYASGPEAEVVLLSDADSCLVARIDELLEALAGDRPRLAGMAAHHPPFALGPEGNESTWRRILEAFGVAERPLRQSYSVAAPEAAGRCPAGYFNNGFVAFNAAAFEEVRTLANPCTRRLRPMLAEGGHDPFYAAQIGLAVAVAKADVEVLALGPEYNCPNSDEMRAHGLGSLADVRVIHYLRKGEFDRHEFLVDREAFRAFRDGPLGSEVNELFRRHVTSLPGVFYAEPDGTGPSGP